MSRNMAWYSASRHTFVRDSLKSVVGELANNAARQGLHIEHEQQQEWEASVGVLQRELKEHVTEIQMLKAALESPELSEYRHVVLEYDFRRRGLRIDCVLLGDGIIAVLEFKRSAFSASDREQVLNYSLNLVEFHEETQRLTTGGNTVVIPMLVQTTPGSFSLTSYPDKYLKKPWDAVLDRPIECDKNGLRAALLVALRYRRGSMRVGVSEWLYSRFSPSSSIIDAAISLYGQHDVSAISSHAAEKEVIRRCAEEVATATCEALEAQENLLIFISGAPGAGKTLVGLQLAFDARLRSDAVFVTGNSPLVEVLTEALKGAYKRKTPSALNAITASGYATENAIRVIKMSTFKIVKAHEFLKKRGDVLGATDGRVVIFDEAQRTYRKGRRVLNTILDDDEAKLILDSIQRTHQNGAVVIALVGHNQAINTGEMGIDAWFEAAERCQWRFAVSDETLSLMQSPKVEKWKTHHLRRQNRISIGHLPHSLRFYRNADLEKWCDYLLAERRVDAEGIARKLQECGDTIWLARDISTARAWIRSIRIAEERAGLIASGQARRLAAEGLFVDLKPSIAPWMLAPTGDVRSSNMLETVQNQYQIQGLELDYTVVCWDGDLRRISDSWAAYKMHGGRWQKYEDELEIAKNSYRVLLTRARRGMIIFVPKGDASMVDDTRDLVMYESIAAYLKDCGAVEFIPPAEVRAAER